MLNESIRRSRSPPTARKYEMRTRDAATTKASTKSTTRKATRSDSAASPIDAYLANVENAAARATLTRLCVQLRELLPAATETISYSMPAFRLPNGKVAAGFAFFGKNCGYYPHSGSVIPKLGALLDGYKTTKGALAFSPDAPLPKKVVSALVRTRLAEIAEQTHAPKTAKAKATTTAKATTARKTTIGAAEPKKPRVFAMSFASVYPLYVNKAERKGRTQQEVDEVIAWLTGYRGKSLKLALDNKVDVETFFGKAPRWNPNAGLITGVVCGVRVEDVTDPLMQKVRYLDKLIDELAKGKKMESVLRR